MKKLAVLLGLGGMLMLAVSMAQAQSEWAFYKENPVQECSNCTATGVWECPIDDGYIGPRKFILDSTEIVDAGDDEFCTIKYYTLDCCACHGPYVPGNHGGPQFPALQCP